MLTNITFDKLRKSRASFIKRDIENAKKMFGEELMEVDEFVRFRVPSSSAWLISGIYSTRCCSCLSEWSSEVLPWSHDMELTDHEGDSFDWYGVSDNVEQILDRCPMLWDQGERKFIIDVHAIRKEWETCQNWRWHKHGLYIGTQKSEEEYLYDEPVIEEILSYSIYEVDDKKTTD